MAKVKKKIIVFDLDGTLSDFECLDNQIIKEIFGNNKLVMFVDKILWKINRLDMLKNTMIILRLRLILYCILSFKNISECITKYRREYFFRTYNDFVYNYYEYLVKLQKKYKIRVISNNKYSKGIEYKGIKVIYRKSKFKCLRNMKKRLDIEYVVGNNLFDDVLAANIINLKSIYIGKNKLIGLFSKYYFKDLFDTLDVFKQ